MEDQISARQGKFTLRYSASKSDSVYGRCDSDLRGIHHVAYITVLFMVKLVNLG